MGSVKISSYVREYNVNHRHSCQLSEAIENYLFFFVRHFLFAFLVQFLSNSTPWTAGTLSPRLDYVRILQPCDEHECGEKRMVSTVLVCGEGDMVSTVLVCGEGKMVSTVLVCGEGRMVSTVLVCGEGRMVSTVLVCGE